MANSYTKRRIDLTLKEDLQKKMVLLSGPRQCGKTTLCQNTALSLSSSHYYNWDIARDKKMILQNDLNYDASLWVFDEIHKYRRWRSFLKGVYDEHFKNHKILVTGSAKLNIYGHGGDSLQGRYFSHRLHPFTLSEMNALPFSNTESILNFENKTTGATKEALLDLLEKGGFPDPLFNLNATDSKRWRLAYGERLIEDELRNLENIKLLDSVGLLYDRLDHIAGSILSINSLREDLDVSFEAVKNWIGIFEKLYACFRIAPYGPPQLKAVKKEQKLYLWDWARIEEPGTRLENLVAVHLMRLIDWAKDIEAVKLELRYFKMRSGPEVDFIVLKNNKPWIAIEVKLQEQPLSTSFKYFLERVKVPFAFQLFLNGNNEKTLAEIQGTSVKSMKIERFLAQLP